LVYVTALAATYATGTIRVLYRPWAKATLCHLTTMSPDYSLCI